MPSSKPSSKLKCVSVTKKTGPLPSKVQIRLTGLKLLRKPDAYGRGRLRSHFEVAQVDGNGKIEALGAPEFLLKGGRWKNFTSDEQFPRRFVVGTAGTKAAHDVLIGLVDLDGDPKDAITRWDAFVKSRGKELSRAQRLLKEARKEAEKFVRGRLSNLEGLTGPDFKSIAKTLAKDLAEHLQEHVADAKSIRDIIDDIRKGETSYGDVPSLDWVENLIPKEILPYLPLIMGVARFVRMLNANDVYLWHTFRLDPNGATAKKGQIVGSIKPFLGKIKLRLAGWVEFELELVRAS